MIRARLFAAPILASLACSALLAACATPSLGPPPPGYPPPTPGEPMFRASEFGWSMQPGANGIAGRLNVPKGQPAHYTCQGSSVILTPETPWSRRRMEVLYLSSERASLPADEVRARTPEAPAGDSTPFIKRTTCDAQSHFSFERLPDGAWYVITIAKPLHGGGALALMRRVVTRGGKVSAVAL